MPTLPGGQVANTAPPGPFFEGHRVPLPTCTWWVGFGAPPNQDAVAAGPFPFMSQCLDDGIAFGLPTKRDFDGVSVHQPAEIDLSASFNEHDGNKTHHRALSWDDLSVTVQYYTGEHHMTAFLVPGAPYMTFKYHAATPTFRAQRGGIVEVNGTSVVRGRVVSVQGSKFRLRTEHGLFLIYSLDGPMTLLASDTRVSASASMDGVLRVAKLIHPGHEQTLDRYAGTYPTGAELDYEFSRHCSATMIFRWIVVGNPENFIQLSWPHHRKSLKSPLYLPASSLSYLTIKGWMVPVLGNTWRLEYQLPSMDFDAPRPPDPSCVPAIIQGLEYEIAALGTSSEPGDFYFWGGAIAAASQLALIAEQVGRSDLVPRVIGYLERSLRCWTDPKYSKVQAAYETNWGAVISKAGATNHHVDFGNGFMNDHHFHYGYLLCAGAVIARHNPAWLEQSNGLGTNADFLGWFARDIANPSRNDKSFPVARHRDTFAGHSWASGIANGAGDRDQESLGEAINGYYGVLLCAIVTKNRTLEDYARLLIATEQAAGIYWQLNPDADPDDIDEPYPEQPLRDLVTIGNCMQWQAGAWLFWGSQKTQIAAIQILPVTPIMEPYYDPTWVRAVLRYVRDELDDPSIGDEWKCLVYLAYSNYDPHAAMEMSKSLTAWGSGNSYSNQLYFIATRPNPSGRPILKQGDDAPVRGTFSLRLAETGRYVSSRSARPELVADADTLGQAAGFTFGFAPGGVTLCHTLTHQYVTADIGGSSPLSAAREKVAAWEIFKLVPCSDVEGVQYTLMAGSNKRFVTLDAQGALVPSADQRAAARFVLTSAPVPKNPSGRFAMQDLSSALWVSCEEGRLVATGRTPSDAAAFDWYGSSMTFRSTATGQWVTAAPDGSAPLAAARDVALAWEHFWVEETEPGCFVMRALVNERFVMTDAAHGLVNAAQSAGEATRYSFHPLRS
ncbi:hypothetical protein EXIGLDRAFT_638608 [Exidia glandulosa HHB12029]|uniref:glucan endo-1,3-beta-D-glucosidase n=1 Tax=Exidia glandulosa HHB12029 TaxID=1314781 RepID=A0A165NV71_EXIGL|nr:hypothetical protein EXIGLDRAFT_638608 [Exidia glandulosa HHB12029]